MVNYDTIEPAEIIMDKQCQQEFLSIGKKVSTFVMMNLALFVSYGLFSLPGSFLPLYNLDRGISVSLTGVVLSTVPFCYIFMCPIAARILDRWSSKKLLLVSSGVVAIVTFLFSTLGHVANNTLYIVASIVLRVGQGLTGGIIDVVAFAVTGKMFPNNIALTTAIVETSLNMAIATSPFIGAVLFEHASFMVAFAVPAATIVLLFLLTFCTVEDVDCRKTKEGASIKEVITDWLILFPAWHCAFSQLLLNFYIPILAPYTTSAFNLGPVFAGICLLVNTAGIILSSPFLGHFMDKYNPYVFFVISAFVLPVTYLFLGPSTFLEGFITPSPTQLMVVLALIGLEMPSACYPSLIIMLDIYKVRHKHIPQSVQNFITSLYCGSFPLGACLGVFISGMMSEFLSFAHSTMIMGFVAILESVFLLVFCYFTRRLKNTSKDHAEQRHLL